MAEQRAGVVLDVDGTLLDTTYLHAFAWRQAFRDAGHDDVPMARLHRLIGRSSADLVSEILGREDEEVVTGHARRYDALRDEVVPLPGARELLAECDRRGLAVVLATSGDEHDLEWMLPALGAEEHLAGVTTSADVEAAKPAPDIVLAAAERAGLDPARAVMVGDTVWDVAAAHRAGMRCIGVLTGGLSEAELREAGADAVHTDPADLLASLDTSPIGALLRA